MADSKKSASEIFAEVWPIERAVKAAVRDALEEQRIWREVKARMAAERSKATKSRSEKSARKSKVRPKRRAKR